MRLVPWALLALLAVIVVVLGAKFRGLREDFQDHRRADSRLQRAAYVPAFTAVSSAGDSVLIGEGQADSRQVLILLTSTCPFCRETLPSWKQIAKRISEAPSSRQVVQVVALTTDSAAIARRYAEASDLPFPLVSLPTRRLASLYRAFVVPQTIVLDSDGRVLFARHGVINTKQAVDSIIAGLAARNPAPTPDHSSVNYNGR